MSNYKKLTKKLVSIKGNFLTNKVLLKNVTLKLFEKRLLLISFLNSPNNNVSSVLKNPRLELIFSHEDTPLKDIL